MSDDDGHSHAGSSRARSPLVDVTAGPVEVEEILVLRRGPGANCSSIGSALDVLFLSATLAGVILVSVAAGMGDAKQASRSGEKATSREQTKEESDEGAG